MGKTGDSLDVYALCFTAALLSIATGRENRPDLRLKPVSVNYLAAVHAQGAETADYGIDGDRGPLVELAQRR